MKLEFCFVYFEYDTLKSCKMPWKTNYYIVLCLITFVVLKSNVVMGGRDDDEDEDPYKTTDPKKREPSPCESNIADLRITVSLSASHILCFSLILANPPICRCAQ